MIDERNQAYTAAKEALIGSIVTQIHELAQAHGTTDKSVTQDIGRTLCDIGEAGLDGRAVVWRARLFIFEAPMYKDHVAESDPELPLADSELRMIPGATELRGLPEVAAWVGSLLTQFHDSVIPEMPRMLEKKLKSLRTQLSYRANGTGDMTLVYTARDAQREDGAEKQYRAKCHVWRGTAEKPKAPLQFGSLKGLR